MTDLVFLDTECLGLDPDAPVWEFAAIRRLDTGGELQLEFTIDHDNTGWLDGFPEQFLADYLNRFDPNQAWGENTAAEAIHAFTKGAIVVGSNPGFDMERLAKLLRRNRLEPEWYYHPIDIPNVVMGYLAAHQQLPEQPWKSDRLSEYIDVDPSDYDRHTAMGDVKWTLAQWDAMTGRRSEPDCNLIAPPPCPYCWSTNPYRVHYIHCPTLGER